MKFFSILLFAVVVGMMIFLVAGCSETEKDVVEEVDVIEDENVIDGQDAGLSEEEAREKAVAIVKKKYQRTKEFVESYQDNPDPDVDFAATLDQILLEETGLSEPDTARLLDIHLEEKPDDKVLETTVGFRSEDLIVEYLRLSFQYPEKTKEELIELFREAVRNGETEVHARIVSEMYDLR